MPDKKALTAKQAKTKQRQQAAIKVAHAAKLASDGKRAERRQRSATVAEVRQSAIDTWNAIDGPKRMRQLAKDDFPMYCRLMFGLLPKSSDVTINVKQMSDAELRTKMHSLLTHDVLIELGYVPVGGKQPESPRKAKALIPVDLEVAKAAGWSDKSLMVDIEAMVEPDPDDPLDQ